MIRAEFIGEAGNALCLSFDRHEAADSSWARCDITADAEDGATWASNNFRLSRQDAAKQLMMFCRNEPARPGQDVVFESQLQALISFGGDVEAAVELALRAEARPAR